MRKRPGYSDVITTITLFVVLGGGAIAAIPGPDGKIHGCYNGGDSGDLRVVDSEELCARGETRIEFNQTGAQGPAGPSGEPGPAGPGGPRGETGKRGPRGKRGKAAKFKGVGEVKIDLPPKFQKKTFEKAVLNTGKNLKYLKQIREDIYDVRKDLLTKVRADTWSLRRQLYFACRLIAYNHYQFSLDWYFHTESGPSFVLGQDACRPEHWANLTGTTGEPKGNSSQELNAFADEDWKPPPPPPPPLVPVK